ncbi:MAG: hypothetical protein AAGG72_00040 [Pseudomonadota bacterium]
MTVPLSQQIACVKREIAFRNRVYPGQVSRGKMRKSEADHEVETMTAVLRTLEWLQLNEADIKAQLRERKERAS